MNVLVLLLESYVTVIPWEVVFVPAAHLVFNASLSSVTVKFPGVIVNVSCTKCESKNTRVLLATGVDATIRVEHCKFA